MGLIEVCPKDIDEWVDRIWRLNVQPAMADEAPNRIAGSVVELAKTNP
jgi:hypothetical protein